MAKRIMDAHIHLDMYSDADRQIILEEMEDWGVDAVISVSNHLKSAEMNLQLSKKNHRIKPAFGFHPEQALPSKKELDLLLKFIHENAEDMVAVGEVGLPYYLRKEKTDILLDPYIELLEQFIQQAGLLNKPVVLHAVYDDAPIVCDLLEKHSIKKAHFHWFKGDVKTIERMRENGYFISITPDVLYEADTQELVRAFPLFQMMVETDGPWPFDGIFQNKLTHPRLLHHSIAKIAELKGMVLEDVYRTLYENTLDFYLC